MPTKSFRILKNIEFKYKKNAKKVSELKMSQKNS